MLTSEELEIANAIIDRIDVLRYECGLSINKLAELADIPESTLKSILSRKICPKILTIYKLCNVFKIAVWQFFLFPNEIISFSKDKLDLLMKIEQLNSEEKKAIITLIEVFNSGKT